MYLVGDLFIAFFGMLFYNFVIILSSRLRYIECFPSMISVPGVGPSNVTAVAISPTSVNVSWGEVDILQQNGMLLGFKVSSSDY